MPKAEELKRYLMEDGDMSPQLAEEAATAISQRLATRTLDAYTAGPRHVWYVWDNGVRARYTLRNWAWSYIANVAPTPV